MKDKRKIGVLGGSFNPPHIAHLVTAEQVREACELDMVLLMPSATPPHKKRKTVIDGHHRVEMVKRAIANNPYLAIEEYEVANGGVNYTVNTMRVLQEKYPDSTLYFIVGSDMVADLSNWHRVDELLHMVEFIGVNRQGKVDSPYNIRWVSIPEMAISSSLIRTSLQSGSSIKYLVPDTVEAYITEHGLYQKIGDEHES